MISKFIFIFHFFITSLAFAQNKNEGKGGDINFFTDIIQKQGVLIIIGIIVFVYAYRNSIKLFDWIEDQTYGTRDYILQQAELLHFNLEPIKITYGLLIITFLPGIFTFIIFSFFGKFFLGLIIAAILMVIGWKTPRPIMDGLVKKRIKNYSLQMVDALNLLSNGLRAGLSLQQSLGMVVDELPDPVAQEFNTILQQTRIGVPLEEAFDNLVKRIPTPDNDMFVTSINILRETGGNLAEVFDSITEVIRERIRVQQKVDVYTAQGKNQGYILFMMPILMLVFLSTSDPELGTIMFTNPIGIILVLVAMGLDVLGLIAILKLTKVEV